MMKRRNNVRLHHISQFVCLIWLIVFSGCFKPTMVDLTLTSPYAQVVGTKYRVISEVDAYGIYENLDKKVISYIELIPGVGIGGPEVAFRKRIAKEQTIKVLSAWQARNLLSGDIYYVISLQDADLPRDIQIRIELSRGNEGKGAELNPRIYEKIEKGTD